MPRDPSVYLDDILEAIRKIESYTKGLSYADFSKSEMAVDAVVRNLEIVGEAVKGLPAEIKRSYPEEEWKKIAGLRDILIHAYFGIDTKILWDVVINKMPKLKVSASKIKNELK